MGADKEIKVEASAGQIEVWKAKYEKVWKLKVADKEAIVRSPERNELSYAAKVGANDPMKYNEYMLKTCWLAGDEEIQTIDSYFMGACGQLEKLIQIQESSLEEL
jgi:hypothetical protein